MPSVYGPGPAPAPPQQRGYEQHEQEDYKPEYPQSLVTATTPAPQTGFTGLASQCLTWLFNQPSSIVPLYLILIAIATLTWYGISYGIPAHLKQIHSGYEEIAEKNRSAHKEIHDKDVEGRKELREMHTKEMDKLQGTFQDNLNRYEKSFAEGYRARGNTKEND